MSIKITLPGLTTTKVKNFSVQEDATPIEPSSSFGGVGRISFSVRESENSPLLIGSVTLIDGTRGKTSGIVNSVSNSDGDVQVVADSTLSLFNTERTVPPFVGTLGAAMQWYSDFVAIPNGIVVDPTVSSRSVVYPGWKGNVWVGIKQILVKEQLELALVFDKIYVRPLRQLTATLTRSTSSTWTIENSSSARFLDVNYYNHAYGVQKELYPLTTEEASIYQVDADETMTFTQEVNASVISVNQPVVQNWVNDESYAGTAGVYSVVGNDGLPIPAAQWLAYGGSLSVSTTDDPNIIDITVHGSTDKTYSPYRIAMSSGDGNYYNSLHVTGTAITWDKRTLRLTTGVSTTTTSDEETPVVDNPFISTLEQAFSLGLKAAQANAGLNYSIAGSAIGINRAGQGRELIRATISDFNLAEGIGVPISDFNTVWAGQTIANFNDYWQGQVDLLFENQLFGNAVGARVIKPDACFRVVSATTDEVKVDYTATLNTLINDFNTKRAGDTIADFNVQFAGYSCKDFSIVPLRRN